MLLSKKVKINRRYKRSINVVDDITSDAALEGYIFPETAKQALMSMAALVGESKQGAFTWTGPYGSGKSSLGIALAAMLSGTAKSKKWTKNSVGDEWCQKFWSRMPVGKKGWQIVPIEGRKASVASLIEEALLRDGLLGGKSGRSESDLVQEISALVEKNIKDHGGLLIFVDEMGKTLEHSAVDGGDVYFLQMLAEKAARSNGRLIIVGVLHQSFQEYASQLSRKSREEWAKIQGRFVDILVDISGDEQIELLARAIETKQDPQEKFKKTCTIIAKQVDKNRHQFSQTMTKTLVNAWPLHPATTCLLGPISRKSFGQNQRSLFGFLNSAESFGFQDFITHATLETQATFTPAMLWDYLKYNLRGAILASSEGHRWALTIDALESCIAKGGDDIHTDTLKTIAILDWLRDQSRLTPSDKVLKACLTNYSPTKVSNAIQVLKKQSLIKFKKHVGGYAVFEGSDFDFEDAMDAAQKNAPPVDLETLSDLISLPPVVAKQHYHETGTLRWSDIVFTPVSNLISVVDNYETDGEGFALFAIVFPMLGETKADSLKFINNAHSNSQRAQLYIAHFDATEEIKHLLEELHLLRFIRDSNDVFGDKVAKREIGERIARVQDLAEQNISRGIGNLIFKSPSAPINKIRWNVIGAEVNDLAGKVFSKAPIIHNELINRRKPSSSAMTGLRKLLIAMFDKSGEQRLGIQAHPAEWGIFESILIANNLYVEKSDGSWKFRAPVKKENPELFTLWEDTKKLLKQSKGKVTSVQDIYSFWQAAPYGISPGVSPLLLIAFVITTWSSLAFYCQGLFRSRIQDTDIGYLLKAPHLIDLRWMELSESSHKLFAKMANLATRLQGEKKLEYGETIDVARALIATFDAVPLWARRTQLLSRNAKSVRQVFSAAHDPNTFLFDDIPTLAGVSNTDDVDVIADNLEEGLREILQAYPEMLTRLKTLLLQELEVPNSSPEALAELRERAGNIKGLSGDHVVEAFIGRLQKFDGELESVADLSGLASGKPVQNWIDPDINHAQLKLSELARTFRYLETVAHINGRTNKRSSMAMIVGLNSNAAPVELQFELLDSDIKRVESLTDKVEELLRVETKGARDQMIAAIAFMGERLKLANEQIEEMAE